MSEITKIRVNGTEYDLPEAPARVSLYIDVPQNPSFPITGTLTSSQQNEIEKTGAPVIAVQVATSESDMVETYYCYCNYLTPHCGLYGSDFYGRYDDTTLLHIKIEHDQSYAISKVSAGSGSSGVSSFGGKTGAIALSDDFEMNGNTLALKKAITSITNFVDAYNDSFDFYEKTIKFTNANYSSGGEYYYYQIEFTNGFSIYGYAGGGMSIQSNDPNAAGQMYDKTIYNTASGGSLPATLELSGVAYGNSYTISGFYGKTTDSGASYVQLTPEQFAAWIMIEFDDLKGGDSPGDNENANDITPAFSLVLPSDVTFPYSGTLTDDQKNLLYTNPVRLQLIDVQITSPTGTDYNKHYLCSNNFINAQYGTHGSTYWAQYDDTKKMKVAFSQDAQTNAVYTISLVEAGGGGGGGGSAALYQHNIETMCDPATYVYMTVYTSDNSPLTSLTPWQMKFGNDKVFGGGYVVYNNAYYPILYTQADNSGVKSYYAGGMGTTATYQWGGTGQWTDNVKEV